MSTTMTPEQLRTWEKLQVVVETLRREAGRDLWREGRLSDTEFAVLAHLHEAGSDGIRPSQCARQMGWDSSRLAHQTRRLEKRGLVMRVAADDSDGRASRIVATADGRRSYRRALGPHLAAVRKWFADGLTDDQMGALAIALDALLVHGRELNEQQPPDKGATS